MNENLSLEERHERDRAFRAGKGWSEREGELWNEAWAAARAYYAPYADEADRLRERLGLTTTARET